MDGLPGRRHRVAPCSWMSRAGPTRCSLIAVLTSLYRWLKTPVIEHCDDDRPFRLRRASLLLLAGGWGVYLISAVAGILLVKAQVPIHGWAELLSGRDVSSAQPVLQWARTVCESIGGATFFAGLASVAFFDRRDGIQIWTLDRQ
ncbi:MAG: hypothetical protein JWM57_265 [Phycisphaerales bacterium]|nr:hypothetical protein [Phycisphaerales bacterium]